MPEKTDWAWRTVLTGGPLSACFSTVLHDSWFQFAHSCLQTTVDIHSLHCKGSPHNVSCICLVVWNTAIWLVDYLTLFSVETTTGILYRSSLRGLFWRILLLGQAWASPTLACQKWVPVIYYGLTVVTHTAESLHMGTRQSSLLRAHM